MSNEYDSFVEGIESCNTAKVARSFSVIGEYDYDGITPIEIDEIILRTNPNSQKSITTALYIMSLYMKHIGNEDAYHMVRAADRRAIWMKAKPNAKKKFISYHDYMVVYRDIASKEEHNSLYQKALFRSVYEGMYCDDMSVLKNIRASDVRGGCAYLRHDDGDSHILSISKELADSLVELGEVDCWWRNNRYGAYSIRTSGLSKDSCFKVENRNGTDEYSYRYSYYRILRKISKEYVGYSLLPFQLYISGIMHRVSDALECNDIDIFYAFSENNKNRLVSSIILNELERSNCKMEVRNFREMVKGHIDVFAE